MEEGFYAFGGVGMLHVPDHDLAGVGVGFGEGAFGLGVEGGFAEGQDGGAFGGDAGGEGSGGGVEVRFGDGVVDEAVGLGGAGVDHVAEEEHFHGGLAGDGAGEGDHGGGAEEADVDAGGGEAGGVGGDGEVCGGDELAAGGGGDAVDAGDDGESGGGDGLHEAAALGEEGLVGVGVGGLDFFEVVAGAEGRAVCGDDGDVDGAVLFEVGQGLFERGHEGGGEGVAGVGAVEGEPGDAGVVLAQEDVGFGHRSVQHGGVVSFRVVGA